MSLVNYLDEWHPKRYMTTVVILEVSADIGIRNFQSNVKPKLKGIMVLFDFDLPPDIKSQNSNPRTKSKALFIYLYIL